MGRYSELWVVGLVFWMAIGVAGCATASSEIDDRASVTTPEAQHAGSSVQSESTSSVGSNEMGGAEAGSETSSSPSSSSAASGEEPSGSGAASAGAAGREADGSGAGTSDPHKVPLVARYPGRSFQARLLRTLAEHWRPPSDLSAKQLERLAGSVVVYVEMDEEGYIRKTSFMKKSSNAAFNESIERVLEQFTEMGGETLPLPEQSELREALLERGMRLKRWSVGWSG